MDGIYKSGAERKIANILIKNNIRFHYEFPIAVVDKGETKIWYPDFYLYEYKIIIEYFGLYNDGEGYHKTAQHKNSIYNKLGFELISLCKTYHSLEDWLLRQIKDSAEENKKDRENDTEKQEKQ
jgi:hypothetical protein